jgi:hypothetical protein
MNKKEQDFEDLSFICERVLWYLQQKPKDLMEYFKNHRMDALHFIPDQKRGMIFFGRDASEKFYSIAQRHLCSQKEGKNKTNLDQFVKKLKEEFSRRFLQSDDDLTVKNMDRMISTAYRAISREFVSLTHYIPCAIFFSRTIDSFKIGPVNFLHKTKFNSTYRDEIDQLRISIKEEHRKQCALAIENGFPAGNVASEEQSDQLANHFLCLCRLLLLGLGLRLFYRINDSFCPSPPQYLRKKSCMACDGGKIIRSSGYVSNGS